jgi:hypothetical protein
MSDVEIKEKEIKKEELKIKNKKWKLIIIIATAIVGALGGSTYEEKKIYKNINSSVIGDGNVVSFNNVDEFIKDYQKTIEDNEKLNDQNTEYYKNYVEIKEQNELLKNQLNDRSYVVYRNLGLYVDSSNISIASDKSQAVIDGKEYYAKSVIEGIVGNNKTITTDDNYMYIGKKVSGRTSLFSDKIWVVDKKNCDVNVSKKDSRGNNRSNALQLTYYDSYIIYNTDKKYNYISFIISIADGSSNTNNVTVSLKDENENVIYSTEISKLDEPIKVTDVAINSCSTLKVEATTANYNSCYCLISEAYVYN